MLRVLLELLMLPVLIPKRHVANTKVASVAT